MHGKFDVLKNEESVLTNLESKTCNLKSKTSFNDLLFWFMSLHDLVIFHTVR